MAVARSKVRVLNFEPVQRIRTLMLACSSLACTLACARRLCWLTWRWRPAGLWRLQQHPATPCPTSIITQLLLVAAAVVVAVKSTAVGGLVGWAVSPPATWAVSSRKCKAPWRGATLVLRPVAAAGLRVGLLM